jgi:hypothetical protein
VLPLAAACQALFIIAATMEVGPCCIMPSCLLWQTSRCLGAHAAAHLAQTLQPPQRALSWLLLEPQAKLSSTSAQGDQKFPLVRLGPVGCCNHAVQATEGMRLRMTGSRQLLSALGVRYGRMTLLRWSASTASMATRA